MILSVNHLYNFLLSNFLMNKNEYEYKVYIYLSININQNQFILF